MIENTIQLIAWQEDRINIFDKICPKLAFFSKKFYSKKHPSVNYRFSTIINYL